VKVLYIDNLEHCGELALRAQEDGHEVKYWQPHDIPGVKGASFKGYLDLTDNWERWMDWADLIVLTGNASYLGQFDKYFKAGYPIFGCTKRAAELENDREAGQRVIEAVGIPVLPYEVFTDYDSAVAHVRKTKKGYASKPWGAGTDKSLSFVAKTPRGLIFKLEKWKKEDKKQGGKFMLQEVVDGIEMAVGAWFGPGGWGKWILENFEEKKFMNDGLGQNTGEQGTILRYVTKSKLFEDVLEPLGAVLHSLDYVGYVDMNCIIDPKTGIPWPLEITIRFGWPLNLIQYALHRGDSVQWMKDLLEGGDSLRVSERICIGIVLTHADFPNCLMPLAETQGYPFYGLEAVDRSDVWLCNAMKGTAPGDGLQPEEFPVSTGWILAVITGTGDTVADARHDVYRTAGKFKEMPTNVMFRTDIGKRLKEQLPVLQKWGFAKGLRYGTD
jgi:phosphoribosylamine---glycine ligase